MPDTPPAAPPVASQARGRLLTAVDMKALFGVDAVTLWRWRKAHLIPAPVRIGGRLYWVPETVWAHLEGLDREAQAKARAGRERSQSAHAEGG